MLRADGIDAGFGPVDILRDIALAVSPGETVVLLGPNGAGKSTLLAAMSGALTVRRGAVTLDECALADWPQPLLARRRAVLAQHSALGFPFRALDVVLLGRSPWAGATSRSRDLAVATACLAEAAVTHLADRIYTTLSGGERQRVQLARVLAQIDFAGTPADGEARYLLLDEPTASLDPAHQQLTLATARRAAARGMGVLAVLHDLNLAAMYADRIAVMRAGRIVASGKPADVLTEAVVESVFDFTVRIERHPTRGCPLVVAL